MWLGSWTLSEVCSFTKTLLQCTRSLKSQATVNEGTTQMNSSAILSPQKKIQKHTKKPTLKKYYLLLRTFRDNQYSMEEANLTEVRPSEHLILQPSQQLSCHHQRNSWNADQKVGIWNYPLQDLKDYLQSSHLLW